MPGDGARPDGGRLPPGIVYDEIDNYMDGLANRGDAALVTVEHDPETAALAQKNFERTGVVSKVRILVGAADRILRDLKGPFDFIFNDIDKAGYPAVLEPCIERLRVGGLLVTDNVLWHGDVARKVRSAETAAIRTYNERLAKDPRMIASIVPLRDGVSVALKVRG